MIRYPNGRPAMVRQDRNRKRRKTKYNNRKVILDGITFDSQVESRYWYMCKRVYMHNDAVEIKYHERFEIVPAYELDGKRHAARRYTPDFTFYEDGKLVKVVDVKGGRATMTDGSSMRINLFMHRYKIPVTIARWNEETQKFDEKND